MRAARKSRRQISARFESPAPTCLIPHAVRHLSLSRTRRTERFDKLVLRVVQRGDTRSISRARAIESLRARRSSPWKPTPYVCPRRVQITTVCPTKMPCDENTRTITPIERPTRRRPAGTRCASRFAGYVGSGGFGVHAHMNGYGATARGEEEMTTWLGRAVAARSKLRNVHPRRRPFRPTST
jgi:hypothetical protein